MTCTVINSQQVTDRALGFPAAGRAKLCSLSHLSSDPGLICSPLHDFWFIVECGRQIISRTNPIKGKVKLPIGAEIKLYVQYIDKVRQQAELSSTADTVVCDLQFIFVIFHISS